MDQWKVNIQGSAAVLFWFKTYSLSYKVDECDFFFLEKLYMLNCI